MVTPRAVPPPPELVGAPLLHRAAQVVEAISDARILPIKRNTAGERYRSIKEVAEISAESDFHDDWLIDGPRSAAWPLQQTGRLGLDPVARCNQWKHDNKQQDDQFTAVIHEVLSEIYEYMLTYDQLDVVNLASAECLLRHMQMTEAKVKKVQESKKEYDANEYYLGRSRRTGGALVCPALTKWVAEKASSDSAILKEQRKATEERKIPKK